VDNGEKKTMETGECVCRIRLLPSRGRVDLREKKKKKTEEEEKGEVPYAGVPIEYEGGKLLKKGSSERKNLDDIAMMGGGIVSHRIGGGGGGRLPPQKLLR